MNAEVVALTGASGQIGRFCVPLLLRHGFEVCAISRQGRPPEYPEFEPVRWLTPEAFEALPHDRVGLLLSAGPVAYARRLVGNMTGLRRAVVVSTTSVETKAESQDKREREQVQAIAAHEQEIRALCLERDTALVLLRPTLIYGCGMDRNISLLAYLIRRFGFLPVSSRAHGLRQPVHAQDLAQTAVNALMANIDRELVTPVVGGSTLAYDEMVSRIFVALGQPVRMPRVPASVLSVAVRLGAWIAPGAGLTPQMVHRQSRDLVFDDSPARRQLGHAPREFKPFESDFYPQSAAQLRKLATDSGSG
ncbi:MAG: hypothetical protein R3348_06815 [Xanthomonadales bacterium]|nr:hypothetical protein [Xanthomonadales bacterium]